MTRLFPLRVWSAIFATAALLIVVLPDVRDTTGF